MSEPESRSPLAVGMTWASRITTLGLEFALPALAGFFLDQRWRTGPVLILVGTTLGFAVGMMHLLRIARGSSGAS